MKKEQEHLPIFGVGPLYVYSILFISIIFIVLSVLGFMDSGKFNFLRIPFFIIGVLLIVYGLIIWLFALFNSKIDKSIKENKLCTTGVYSLCRNPIYSAFTIAISGLLFIFNNVYLLILPILFYIYLTILLKHTEEKWLLDLYQDEYRAYMKRVNRIIPFFSNK